MLYSLYNSFGSFFCIWICASGFGCCYLNTVKVSNFVRAKKWIWWGNSSTWWRIGLEDLKCPFQLTSVKCETFSSKSNWMRAWKVSVCNTIVFCLLILTFLDLQFDRVINNYLNPKEIFKKITALLHYSFKIRLVGNLSPSSNLKILFLMSVGSHSCHTSSPKEELLNKMNWKYWFQM